MSSIDMVQPRLRAFTLILIWIAFAGWVTAIWTLSSIPGSRIPSLPFPEADKVAHACLYALGAFILAAALRRALPGGKPIALNSAALVIMIALGVLDEVHQLGTPGRSGGDLFDLSADAIGAALGIGFFHILHALRHPRSHHNSPGADRAA
ncbi:MAG TPA: VanZ family protein [Chthoniobacterales bacterium]